MKEKKQHEGITGLETATYAMSGLGRQATLACVDIFFLSFLNIYMGLNVVVVTAAIVLIRILDALVNPLLASIINNSRRGRWGRYRPWMLAGAVSNCAALLGMFYPVGLESQVLRHAYYIAMFLLWGLTFTLLEVPVWAMVPTIANSTDDRNKVTSMSRLVGSFGGFIVISLGTSLIIPKVAASNGIGMAHFALAAAAAAMVILFVSITVLFTKERYDLPADRITVREIFGMFRENDQLGAFSMSYLPFIAGVTTATFQQIYLFIYYGDMGGLGWLNQGLGYTIFSVLSGMGMGFSMIFYQLLVKKIPRQKVYGASFFLASFGMAAVYFIFFALRLQYGSLSAQAAIWINVALVAAAAFTLSTSAALSQIGSSVMVADITDYGEWKTGRRSDSVIFSVQTLLTKLASATAVLIIGLGVKVARLPAIREIFNQELGEFEYQFLDEAGAVLSSGALDIFRAFMFLVPIPLCLIGYFIYRKKFWLYGERYEQIKAEVDARREGE